MVRALLIALIALALAATGCGGGDADPAADEPATARTAEESAEPPAGAPEPDPQPVRAPGTEIATAPSDLGQALFDGDAQAIYYFEPEGTSEPQCYGSCAAAWPPVLTVGEPRASSGARQGLLGTVERRGGGLQVTYAGRPLYYYADEAPGELRCHNIDHEGGLWLAVRPNGEPVPHDPARTIRLD
jgi:predicted lipoprotein with Yx(FWY)xxD motif